MEKDNSWLQKRGCGIHMTIRDIDCDHFDADRMAREFREMGATFFSFFAGGYITTYPSELAESRRSPWLGGQDITRDIVGAAHRYGLKAIAMADLSVLPPDVAAKHPDWVSLDIKGRPYESVSGMYTACIMGGYGEEYGRRMVAEILEHYDVDGMKFGGGSYGFHGDICYCEGCRSDYEKNFHRPLPEKVDWNDPNFLTYHRWRQQKTSERCKFLHDMVKSIRPDMPVMGNGVCFGAVDWTTNSALDIEDMAAYQDMIQLEAQDRARVAPDMTPAWQSMTWTGEEACYMTNVADEKPIWIVVSYFKAWPWRRSAVDYAEQKAYMAQIAANGATPMVNLSGGPLYVHEDRRGIRAPAELYAFMGENIGYYDGDRSGATVAMVYSQDTLVHYGKTQKEVRYLEGFRGYEKALQENHIPYDILSTRVLEPGRLSRYKVLVLPTLACLSETAAQTLREFVRGGGSVVSTFETGLFDETGEKREGFLIGDLLGADYQGETAHVNGPQPEGKQNYCRIGGESELLKGLEGTRLIPAAGRYCRVSAAQGARVPLTLTHPFIVFPEGLSYTAEPDIGDPMLIAQTLPGGGRTVYFPGQPDRFHWKAGFADLSLLMANAVIWAAGQSLPVTCEAPDTLYITFRRKAGRNMVHLVNLTGGQRYFKQVIPVRGISVGINRELCAPNVRAFLLSDKKPLAVTDEGGRWQVTIPELKDYDVLVFEDEP